MKYLFRYGNAMTDIETDAYVLAAHPSMGKSRVNRLLMRAASMLPRVHKQDLYASDPDYFLTSTRPFKYSPSGKFTVIG